LSAATTTRPGGGAAFRLFGLAVSVVAVALVIRSVDVGSSVDVLRRANPIPLAACIGVIGVQLVLRSIRWRQLLPLTPAGRRVSAIRIVPVLLVGYLGNAVLPARLGEPIRAYLVARRESLDAVEAFGSVVLERVVDTVILALLAFLAAEAVGADAWIVQATGLAAAIGIAVTAALVVVGPGRLVAVARSVAGRLPRSRFLASALDRLDDFSRGIDRPSRSSAILVAALVSGICWLLDASIYWLVARSIGLDLSPATALLIGAVTVLGTAIPSAPGYVGTYDLALVTTAEAFGVAAAPAVAFAVLAHAITVLPPAIAGGLAMVGMQVGLGRLATDADSARHAAHPASEPPEGARG